MTTKKLGSSDVCVSSIVLGTWAMGGDYFGAIEDKDSIRCIQTNIENGVTTIDSAEIYGNGRAEVVVGRSLQGVSRDKYVMLSKAWTSHFGKDSIREAAEGSIKRLGCEYLDVYFLHYPPVEQSIAEAMESIARLKSEGIIRAIGVSNFSLDQLKEARKYGQVDVIQPCYNLLWRYIDRDILPYCIENNIGIITYSSIAQGLLTGKMTKDTVIEDGRKKAALFQPGVYERCLEVTDFVKKVAQKYKKTPTQVCINWLFNTTGITASIVGCKNEAQALENIDSLDFTLSKEDYDAINQASRDFTDKMPEYELFFRTDVKK